MLNLNLVHNLHHLLIRMTKKYCKIFKALKEFNNKKNKKHLLKKLKKKKIYRKIKLYNNWMVLGTIFLKVFKKTYKALDSL
jgi:hypothetical protein